MDNLAIGTVRELRFAAYCLISFYGFLRFNETSNLRFKDISSEPDHFKIFVSRSKTDVYNKGEYVTIAKGIDHTDPFTTLERYIGKFEAIEETSYLFRPIANTKTGEKVISSNKKISYSRMRSDFILFLSQIADNAQIYSLHSCRSGGATAAAKAGVADRIFKKHGRWKSEAAKDRYVHEEKTEILSVSRRIGRL